MSNLFDLEISKIFPFEPYKVQLEFMRGLYNILKNSNIINEQVNSFYEFIKNSENAIDKLRQIQQNSLNIFDQTSILSTYNYNNKNEHSKEENNHEKHIICEMKTGSGKSLTLLAPLIYWLLKHKFDLFIMKENLKLKADEPEWIKESIVERAIEKYANILEKQKKKQEYDTNILNKYFTFVNDKVTLIEQKKIEKRVVEETNRQSKNMDDIPLIYQ
ncbi:DEAD box helicase, putative, partial [Hepatocystis sp. ex Piliocolobus tephrosceles]